MDHHVTARMEFGVQCLPTNTKYFNGYVKFGGAQGDKEPCKVFKMKPKSGLLENQLKIKEIAHYAHSRALLVPIVVTNDFLNNNGVLVAYYFKQSLQEWLSSPKHLKLFNQVNGIMNSVYRGSILALLETIVCMHKNFVYHGDLGNIDSYVIREDNVISIVKPKHVFGARNEALERADFVAFKEFCKKLPRGFESEEWNLFLADYDKFLFDTTWILMHPVLYGAPTRFHLMRIILTRILNRWDNKPDDFEEMTKDLKKVALYGVWKDKIPFDTPFREQYKNPWVSYQLDNGGLAKYIEHVLKHVNSVGSTAFVEREIHNMFPAILSKLHSFFAEFKAKEPRAQLNYHCQKLTR